MAEFLVTVLFLAVVPAVLWACPKTRRMTGSWLTALKTAPVGCLTAFLLSTLAWAGVLLLGDRLGLFHLRRGMNIGIQLLIAVFCLAVGIWTLVFLSRLIWRRYRAVGKRSFLPHTVIFVFLGCAAAAISLICSLVEYSMDMCNYHGSWRQYRLPAEKGAGLAFEERQIHPFLAEYEYRIRFSRNGEPAYRPLMVNTGGRTRINLYRLRDGRLLFSDKDGDYIVEAGTGEVLYLFRSKGELYAVSFPAAPFNSWGWGEENGRMIFRHNGKKTEAFPIDGVLKGKTYYGCITDDFYAASEHPELKIDEWRKFR